jgi:hypothetical protein|nr:MAG TPA: hypothetical protein [Bacteriophage sp.]
MKKVSEYSIQGINAEEQEKLEKYLKEMDDTHIKLYVDQYGRLWDEYHNYICDVVETEIY